MINKYLWVVLGVACVQRDGLEIKTTVKVDSSNDVPFGITSSAILVTQKNIQSILTAR